MNNLGAQRLAAVIAKQTGMPNAFDERSPMLLRPGDSAPSGFIKAMVDSKAGAEPSDLAKHFKEVPALRASGYSLEADVFLAQGKPNQARVSLQKAHALERTPLVYERIGKIPEGGGMLPTPYRIDPNFTSKGDVAAKKNFKGIDKKGGS